MITDDERFIKIQGILSFSDIHPNDCIKINDLIIDLSKQNQHLQSVIDKAINYTQSYDIALEDIAEYEYHLLEILRSKE